MNRHPLLHFVRFFFPLAYHQPNPKIEATVLNLHFIGMVCDPVRPGQPGQIEYCGSWWSAVCLDDIVLLPGTRVKVIDRVDLTLVIEPIVPPQSQINISSTPNRFTQTDQTA